MKGVLPGVLWMVAVASWLPAQAQDFVLDQALEHRMRALEAQVIEWRRDFHEHPELSNREVRTAEKVADHLKRLGLDVTTGVAHPGVVGLLVGEQRGPVVALRADMDALPVTERVAVPFASRQTALYNGEEVGVMHACGHDTHVAILMAVAEVLAEMRDELPGTVKFIFQPAEEGAPVGEEGGAMLMVEEGILTNPPVDAAFALHIDALTKVPSFYFIVGGRPPDVPLEETADHHTPDFFIDESGLIFGVRAMTAVTLASMQGHTGEGTQLRGARRRFSRTTVSARKPNPSLPSRR